MARVSAEQLRPDAPVATTVALPSRAWSVRADLRAVLALAVLVSVSACVRYFLAVQDQAPWIFPDEWIYSELARSFAASRDFSVWGAHWPIQTYGPLYPVVISPAYAYTDGVAQAYTVVKAINAVLMSLAAIPAYFLARRLVSQSVALFVSVLTVLVPSMVYTTKVMTENVAYPVFLMTTLAFVRALERPSNGRQLVALGMIAVAVMARAEMLVLVPACLSVLLLIAVLDVRAEERGIRLCSVSSRLGSYKLTWLVTAGGLLALLALGSTMLPGSLLGAHDRVVHALVFSSAPRRFLYQVAELDLAIGVIPFAAFLLTAMLVFRDPRLSRNARVHVAVAVSFFFWFMLLGALYATQARVHSHVFERYVFYVMPLLFLSLALWMARGLPRPKPWGALVPVVAALLPATLPFTSLLDGREWGVSSSTPGLVPWALLRFAIGAHGLMIVAVLSITTMLAGLVLVVRPEGRQRLLVVLTLTLLAVSLTIGVANAALSRLGGTFRNDVDPAWIDAAVGSEAEVGAIWSGDQTKSNNAYRLLEDQFFNSSVRTVYDLRRPMKPGVPSQPLTVRGARLFLRNGASAGRPLVLDYVLTEPSIGIVGRPVATSPGSRLVLYRVGGDVQLTPAGVRRLAGSPEPSELDR